MLLGVRTDHTFDCSYAYVVKCLHAIKTMKKFSKDSFEYRNMKDALQWHYDLVNVLMNTNDVVHRKMLKEENDRYANVQNSCKSLLRVLDSIKEDAEFQQKMEAKAEEIQNMDIKELARILVELEADKGKLDEKLELEVKAEETATKDQKETVTPVIP